jgi:hypothetical protein
MPVFTRRAEAPPTRTSYADYREDVRSDFTRCCAYCLMPEQLAGGESNFQLDHFLSRSAHPDLINHYFNLYWACSVCNRYKGKRPNPLDLAAGARFVDTANEEFDAHYDNLIPTGEWLPISKPAEYTAERLRLNNRHNRELREWLNKIAAARNLPPVDWTKPSEAQVVTLMRSVTS